jgi:hypothetical protein
VQLRQTGKLGPARIAPLVGLPASTVYRVLVRHGLNRLVALDRSTGQPIRRYMSVPSRASWSTSMSRSSAGRPGGGHRVHGRDSTQHRTRDRDR